MEHPERYPTPTLTPQETPHGTPTILDGRAASRHVTTQNQDGSVFIDASDEEDGEPPPPYPGIIAQADIELSPYLEGHELDTPGETSPVGATSAHEGVEVRDEPSLGYPEDETDSVRDNYVSSTIV